LGEFVDEHELGRVMSNDSGVITERESDTVRGADVTFYSLNRHKAIRQNGPFRRGPLSCVRAAA